jgi:hypothetical protein
MDADGIAEVTTLRDGLVEESVEFRLVLDGLLAPLIALAIVLEGLLQAAKDPVIVDDFPALLLDAPDLMRAYPIGRAMVCIRV